MVKGGKSSDLWAVVEETVTPHRFQSDGSALDALNRIFAKHLDRASKLPKMPSFGATDKRPRLMPETCAIRLERWTPKQLKQLVRTHDRLVPRRDVPPLIAVRYRGRVILLDGTNRANKWIAEGRRGPHEIIVIAPRPGGAARKARATEAEGSRPAP